MQTETTTTLNIPALLTYTLEDATIAYRNAQADEEAAWVELAHHTQEEGYTQEICNEYLAKAHAAMQARSDAYALLALIERAIANRLNQIDPDPALIESEPEEYDPVDPFDTYGIN